MSRAVLHGALRLRALALYAVGDIQGCYRTLQRLLRRIGFRPGRDRLWLVGDLVNRGPRSLEVLRWARRMEDHLTVVLGNHDLHLIGRAYKIRREKPLDTLDDVLHARDRFELINWLRRQPLLHRQGRFLMVHAGLNPRWTPGLARSLAREAEQVLRGPDVEDAILAMRKRPQRWRPGLARKARLRVTLQTLTGLRTCSKSGRPCAGFSGRPESAPHGCHPWFEAPGRRSEGLTIVCGHWAALGLRLQRGLIALDTGCVWGRALTAVRLFDRAVYQEPMVD